MKLEIPIQCIERLFCAFTMIIFVPKLYSNIIKKEKKNTRSFSVSLIKESQILGKEFIKSRQIFWKSGYHAFVYFLFPSVSTDQKTQQPQNNINWKVIILKRKNIGKSYCIVAPCTAAGIYRWRHCETEELIQ